MVMPSLMTPRFLDVFLKTTLYEVGASYFSLSVFNGQDKVVYSFCDNPEWMEVYSRKYLPLPPVKQHIKTYKKHVIQWDADFFDSDTSRYIKERQDVCGVKSILTFVPVLEKNYAAVSVGSSEGAQHLYNVFTQQRERLEVFFKACLVKDLSPKQNH